MRRVAPTVYRFTSHRLVLICSLLLVTILPITSHAGGFRLIDQDPHATARGNAVVASANRASSAYYNPAGMVQLEDPEVHLGYHLVHLDADYQSADGQRRSSNKSEFRGPPQFFGVLPFRLETGPKIAVGFALYSPFGLGLEWPDDSGFRTLAKKSELMYLTASPTIAVAVTDRFSLGAGVNFNYADLTLSQGLSPDPNSGRLQLEGDDTTIGFSVGALYRATDSLALGARYVSPSYMDLSGDSDVNGMAGGFSTRFAFPDFVTAGIAYTVNKKFDIEINYDWTNWDRLTTVTFRDTPAGDIPSELNYSSSSVVSVGGTYRFAETWSASAGYYFNENSIPTATFNPAVPDLDKHYLGFGLSKVFGNLELSCAYQYAFSGTRKVRNSAPSFAGESADGEYQVDIHALALALVYRM